MCDEPSGRYQLIYDPCKETKESYWGRAVFAASSLIALDDCSRGRFYWDQLWHVVDTKTGRNYSRERFYAIVREIREKKYNTV